MGVAQAGIAFRQTAEVKDLQSLVAAALGRRVEEIPRPDFDKFDIRNGTDVMVQNFNGVLFICSDALVWNLLENPSPDVRCLNEGLGSPQSFVAFCNYQSGDSYGYAVVDAGVRIRSRLQTTGVDGAPLLVEYGEPYEFERRWLSAPSFFEEDGCPAEEHQRILFQSDPRIEVSEHYLTRHMLGELLEDRFGLCPWDAAAETVYNYFRVKTRRSWKRLFGHS